MSAIRLAIVLDAVGYYKLSILRKVSEYVNIIAKYISNVETILLVYHNIDQKFGTLGESWLCMLSYH